MKVTSPVGDYPYEIRRVRVSGGRIVVEGGMGVWDTTMEIEPADLAALARHLARPLGLLAAAGLAGYALRLARR